MKVLLQPELYGAREVGYDYDVTANERGVVLSVSGLSDTAILQQVMTTATNGGYMHVR